MENKFYVNYLLANFVEIFLGKASCCKNQFS